MCCRITRNICKVARLRPPTKLRQARPERRSMNPGAQRSDSGNPRFALYCRDLTAPLTTRAVVDQSRMKHLSGEPGGPRKTQQSSSESTGVFHFRSVRGDYTRASERVICRVLYICVPVCVCMRVVWDLSGKAPRMWADAAFAHCAIEAWPFRGTCEKEWTKGKWIFLVLRRSADGQTDGLTCFKGTRRHIVVLGPICIRLSSRTARPANRSAFSSLERCTYTRIGVSIMHTLATLGHAVNGHCSFEGSQIAPGPEPRANLNQVLPDCRRRK